MLSSLSVFFPVFNEEPNIEELIATVSSYLPKISKKYEIIVVNDGSVDNTAAVVAKLQKKYKNVRMVTHSENRGYGATLKTGIENAKYEWTFWMDSDLQFDIQSLNSFLPYVDTHGAIIGYRAHRADTFIRKVNGELYTQLINVLFGLGVRDIDCAFKLIQTKKLHEISIKTSSAFTSSEILIKLKKKGVHFKQIPVPHFPRKKGNPTGGNIRVIFKGLWQTFQYFLHQSE